ncbi:MAG: hypothetical protein GKR77_04630 [Legionellales bacterium]|nr:hypothetical protein [Legionellales bacterium]
MRIGRYFAALLKKNPQMIPTSPAGFFNQNIAGYAPPAHLKCHLKNLLATPVVRIVRYDGYSQDCYKFLPKLLSNVA